MKFRLFALAAVFAATTAAVATPALADSTLYSQPYNNSEYGYYSYTGSYIAYDNFQTTYSDTVNSVSWGDFPEASLSAFTIDFYADSAGAPGALLSSTAISSWASSSVDGLPSYSSAITPFATVAGTQYWISIVANASNLWIEGAGGDGVHYEAGYGSDANDLDFALTGTTPEPSSITLLATGLLGVAGVARRRFLRA